MIALATSSVDAGSTSLTVALTAVGSNNQIRVTITNDDPSYAFSGAWKVTFVASSYITKV